MSPGKAIPAQTLTGIKLWMFIKLNILIWYWNIQQNQCLYIKKHVVHNIHRLTWGSYARGPPGNCPAYPCTKTGLGKNINVSVRLYFRYSCLWISRSTGWISYHLWQTMQEWCENQWNKSYDNKKHNGELRKLHRLFVGK